jgi:hypothetical protein
MIKYTIDLRPGIIVNIEEITFVGFSWRETIGEKWDIGKLELYIKNWKRFIKKNETLIYRSILNYGDSREKLSVILDDLFSMKNGLPQAGKQKGEAK